VSARPGRAARPSDPAPAHFARGSDCPTAAARQLRQPAGGLPMDIEVDVHTVPGMLTALRLPSFQRHWSELACPRGLLVLSLWQHLLTQGKLRFPAAASLLGHPRQQTFQVSGLRQHPRHLRQQIAELYGVLTSARTRVPCDRSAEGRKSSD
jgi:hypothetical protein